MEGYTTLMSDMPKLGDVGQKLKEPQNDRD